MKNKVRRLNKRVIALIGIGIVILLTAGIWAVFAFMPHTIEQTPKIIPPDTISEHDMAIVDNQLLLMNTKGIMAYDKKGAYQWDYALKTAVPYLAASTGKTFTASDGENAGVWNLTRETLNYSLEETAPITGVIVNKNGYTGTISSEHGYRSILTVYDDYGTEVYKWYSGEAYITAAALADNDRYLVTAGLKTGAQDIQTVLQFFDMQQTEPLGQVILENCVAYKLLYDGTDVYVLTDNAVYCYNRKGTQKYTYSFAGRTLHAFAFSDADNITLALNSTDEAGSMLSGSQVVALTKHLKEKSVQTVSFEVSAMDARDGYIVVTGLRNVWLMKRSGAVKAKSTLTGDSERVLLFDKGKAFVTLAGRTASIYSVHIGY